MKIFIKLTCILALLSVSNNLAAQDTEEPAKPGWFVLHQNKVQMENIEEMNALQDSLFAPILNKLVDEGKLRGWGQLTHAWGDEWNYNFYFITDNHRAFIDFWSEYISLVNKRDPEGLKKIAPLILNHKDNMYSIRTMR